MKVSNEMLDKINANANTNPYEQAARNVKGEKDKKNDSVEQRPSPKPVEQKPETTQDKKSTKKDATDKASEVVSKRLNISDITDATKKAKKKGGRSRTFYFQDEMYDKLVEVATKQGIKPSQLLHAILDNVLDKM